MFKEHRFLAIIPARGGSKRLPQKNRLDLHGKPLIAWTIEAAINSSYLDKLIVSSDDDKILDISRAYKASTIKRPAALASDTAPSYDAIEHVIANTVGEFDYIVLLQATSPLRGSNDIDKAIELLFSKKADAIISVCETQHPPLWSNTLPSDGDMSHFLSDELKHKRSQDLEKYYQLNGAIYICKTDKLLKQKSFYLEDNVFAYKMDKKSSVDIDEEIDFKLAEAYIEKMIP